MATQNKQKILERMFINYPDLTQYKRADSSQSLLTEHRKFLWHIPRKQNTKDCFHFKCSNEMFICKN